MNATVLFRLFFVMLATFSVRADDWPQWLGPDRDSIWRETNVLSEFPAGGPKLIWKAPVGGGYSGPAVANGKVFVTDRVLAASAHNPSDPFQKGTIPGSERTLCFNESDGKLLWKHEYDCDYTMSYPAGPRASPLVHDGKVYTLGAEGNLNCLDSKSGKALWFHDFKKDFYVKTPMWGFAGNPLLDGDHLVCLVGAENGTVMAFDRNTGKELWRALNSKEPGYSSPMIAKIGGRRVVIAWTPEGVNGMVPETGKVLWSEPFASRMGLSVATPRQYKDDVFVSSFYSGSLMIDAASAPPKVLWKTLKPSEKNTTHLNAILSTPFIDKGYIYGVCSYGQLRCLKADTGERVWETFKATTGGEELRWANAFIVKNGDRFFLFNEKGDLIIARLTPKGYDEISRAHLIEPTNPDAGRNVVWTHPAYANQHVYVRNDKELACFDLSKNQ
jgi:outer membrane protein assembly factor BamB